MLNGEPPYFCELGHHFAEKGGNSDHSFDQPHVLAEMPDLPLAAISRMQVRYRYHLHEKTGPEVAGSTGIGSLDWTSDHEFRVDRPFSHRVLNLDRCAAQ
jgi:hypothetical protein